MIRRTVTVAAMLMLLTAPAHAAVVNATPTDVTITNDTDKPAFFLVRIHDGSAEFTLQPGESKTFRSVNAPVVEWAVWEEGPGLIANGTMQPLEPAQPEPDTVEPIVETQPVRAIAPTAETEPAEQPLVWFLIAGRWAA